MKIKFYIILIFIMFSTMIFTGCSGGGGNDDGDDDTQNEFTLTSTAFSEGGTIPQKYTCDGDDVSPPLQWSNVPSEAKSLVLLMYDPDAPGDTWYHWAVYDIPITTQQFDENIPKQDEVDSIKQGVNDFNEVGYGGPCPPSGATHRYYFKLIAIKDLETLDIDPGALYEDVEFIANANKISEATLMGIYSR